MNKIQLDTPLLSLLMPWYRDVGEYQEICETEQAQFDILSENINAVAENFFFQTMDEQTVAQWEKIMGITPNPSEEDLDFRRSRIQNRISIKPPFTLEFLHKKLVSLLGKGNYEIDMDYPRYTLYIKSSAKNQLYAQEISFTVNSVKPCHIVYVNMPLLTDSVQLNESVYLAETVWNYRLGYWGLGDGPFIHTENKEEIVTPNQKTIQPAMLSSVAESLQNSVKSARLNGNIVISDITSSISGGTVSFSYTVTPQQASEITSVELLDAQGNALTFAAVYVPVTDTTTFSHNIVVKEET